MDSWENRVWQCRIKCSRGVFIPFYSCSPALLPHSQLLLLALLFLLHCVIQGLIPVLSFNIFLQQVKRRKWNTVSKPRTMYLPGLQPDVPNWWVNTQNSPQLLAENQYAALLTPLKIKQLYSGGLSIWNAVNTVRPSEWVNVKKELGWKDKGMHLLVHLGQGFLMIYRLAQGLLLLSALPHKDMVDATPYNWAHTICLFTAAGS